MLDHEILSIFQAETNEHLVELGEIIAGLPTLSAEQLAETLAHARRLAHNIKGAAAIVGREEIEALAHALEDALEPYHRAQRAPPESLLIVLETTVNVARRAVEGESVGMLVDEMIGELAAEAGPPGESSASPAAAAMRSSQAAAVVASASVAAMQEARASPPGGPEGVTSTIRVETERLDRLMAFSGAMLVAQAHLGTQSSRIESFQYDLARVLAGTPLAEAECWRELVHRLDDIVRHEQRAVHEITQLGGEMNDAMKRLRMLPLRALEPVWRRVVSDAAAKVGKEVELCFELGDVELDRYLLDKIRDPLMHFLRNAVDHGIETAEERSRIGKPATGRVLIRSTMVGTRVRIEISDDGRGFSREKILAGAIARGLVPAAEAASVDDGAVLGLMFLPGFSTAERVSRLSGRGVGLDVVKRRVEELGGVVEIEPQATLGGATFALTLPVSLLSSKGLLLRAASSTFVVPAEAVSGTLRVDVETLADLGGSVLARPNADPLRVCWLTELLGLPASRRTARINVVVLRLKDKELGIVVDEVLAEQELVTKPLPWNLKHVPGVHGVIRLADDVVGMALDVGHLFDGGDVTGGKRPSPAGHGHRRSPAHVLVVDDSATARSSVEAMLTRGDFRVSSAADGEEAWQRLQSEAVDVVISDVQMPRLDGFGLTRRIRSSEALRHLSVILVTNLSSADDIANGAAAGADEYLVKGTFTEAALLGALARLV